MKKHSIFCAIALIGFVLLSFTYLAASPPMSKTKNSITSIKTAQINIVNVHLNVQSNIVVVETQISAPNEETAMVLTDNYKPISTIKKYGCRLSAYLRRVPITNLPKIFAIRQIPQIVRRN